MMDSPTKYIVALLSIVAIEIIGLFCYCQAKFFIVNFPSVPCGWLWASPGIFIFILASIEHVYNTI